MPYRSDARVKKRLNGRKTQPNRRSIARCSRSRGAPAGFRRTAESAGESVSAVNAEMTVEKAIVIANWR